MVPTGLATAALVIVGGIVIASSALDGVAGFTDRVITFFARLSDWTLIAKVVVVGVLAALIVPFLIIVLVRELAEREFIDAMVLILAVAVALFIVIRVLGALGYGPLAFLV